MKVLVTGATGLVGNNVVRQLLDAGNSVRVITRSTADPRPLDGLQVEQFSGDVRDAQSVRAACGGVDAVVHAAGFLHIGWTQRDIQHEINVVGTQNIAEAALANDIRLVHVSTVNTLGLGEPNRFADEDSPAVGFIPCGYVTTKTAAEHEILKHVQRGLNAVIVNPGFMLGPWDWKPSSGRMLLEVHRKFTPFAPKGGCSLCDVRDVAAGIVTAIQKGAAGRRFILAGHNLSYLELWRLFADTSGGSGPWMRSGPIMRIVAGRFGDIRGRLFGREPDLNSAAVQMSNQFHYYTSERARQELGYAIRSARETVADAWEWFKKNGYA